MTDSWICNLLKRVGLPVGQLSSGVMITLAGQVAGMILALASIPLLLDRLGAQRFGGLSMLWIVANYAYLLDFGLSRAVTRFVAEEDVAADGRAGGLIASAIVLTLAFGIFGACVLFVFAPVIVTRLLAVPVTLHAEMIGALRIVAFAIPLALVGAVLNGVLEARRKFGAVGLFYMVRNVINYIAPLLAVSRTTDLRYASLAMTAGQLAVLAGLWMCCCVRRGDGPVTAFVDGRLHGFRRLVSFGGWIAVSNVVSHLMILSDRTMIASMLSLEALTWYTTPLELLTRLLVIPHAFGIVLFPVFSSLSGTRAHEIGGIYSAHTKWLAGILVCVLFVFVAFPDRVLTLWIGDGVTGPSAPVLMILSAGIFCNALTFIPLTVIHGVGRPDISALVHLVELPLYIGCLWVLIMHGGIIGAAVAWSLRAFLDCAVMTIFSYGLLRKHAMVDAETKSRPVTV